MKHTDIKDIFTKKELIGTDVTVCGWVRTARDSKNVAFLALNDGTTLEHLQIVIDKNGLCALPGRHDGADSEHGVKRVCAYADMRNFAQGFELLEFFLERVIG